MTKIMLEFDEETERKKFETARDGHKYQSVLLELIHYVKKIHAPRNGRELSPVEVLVKMRDLANQRKLHYLGDKASRALEAK